MFARKRIIKMQEWKNRHGRKCKVGVKISVYGPAEMENAEVEISEVTCRCGHERNLTTK